MGRLLVLILYDDIVDLVRLVELSEGLNGYLQPDLGLQLLDTRAQRETRPFGQDLMTKQISLDRTFDLGVDEPSLLPVGRPQVDEATALTFVTIEGIVDRRVRNV